MRYLVISLFIVSSMASSMAQSKKVTRANRWEGAVRGCFANHTLAEREKYGSKLPRLCTCLATLMVSKCAPSDSTSNEAFVPCVTKLISSAEKQVAACVGKGTEPDKNPYL